MGTDVDKDVKKNVSLLAIGKNGKLVDDAVGTKKIKVSIDPFFFYDIAPSFIWTNPKKLPNPGEPQLSWELPTELTGPGRPLFRELQLQLGRFARELSAVPASILRGGRAAGQLDGGHPESG